MTHNGMAVGAVRIINLKLNRMKYLKILIDLRLWHLIPYKMPMEELETRNGRVKFTEVGWLCFKLIATWK